jgi:hypothetical protein
LANCIIQTGQAKNEYRQASSKTGEDEFPHQNSSGTSDISKHEAKTEMTVEATNTSSR